VADEASSGFNSFVAHSGAGLLKLAYLLTGAVHGYNPEQAATVVARCLALWGMSLPGAVLRTAATDFGGTTVVITTTRGWETCNLAVNGVPTASGSIRFQTWATANGWAGPPAGGQDPGAVRAPTDAPGYFLPNPLQVLSAGASVVGPPVTGWRNYIIGRAAAGIRRVTAVMASGDSMSASVQNGMFVIDQLTTSESLYGPGSHLDLWGYNAAGQLVYQTPTTASVGKGPCYATPDGQAVTPPITGQTCQTAIPWV